MSTKGFLLLVVTVIVIGGSIGGAFSAGLALGRSQNDGATTDIAGLQQRFGGGQPSSGGLPGGGFSAPQPGGVTSDGPGAISSGETQVGGDAPTGFGGGGFGGRGGFGDGTSAPGVLNGTIGAVDGNVLTITTDSGESQVTLVDGSTIQIFETGTAGQLSSGDLVLVIGSGDLESGNPVDATLVIVNPPDAGGIFGAGGFGGRGGFGGGGSSRVILNGTIELVDDNVFTVTTDSGETQVTLGEESTIQIYETATAGDLSTGDRVLVRVSGDIEGGDPVVAASVTVNPPEGGGLFSGRGFGGRTRGQ